mgnify:CR=1 FL=1
MHRCVQFPSMIRNGALSFASKQWHWTSSIITYCHVQVYIYFTIYQDWDLRYLIYQLNIIMNINCNTSYVLVKRVIVCATFIAYKYGHVGCLNNMYIVLYRILSWSYSLLNCILTHVLTVDVLFISITDTSLCEYSNTCNFVVSTVNIIRNNASLRCFYWLQYCYNYVC